MRGRMDHPGTIGFGLPRPEAIPAHRLENRMRRALGVGTAPFGHLGILPRVAVDRPRRAMAVRLAGLVSFLHVREHVEVGVGIVVQDAPARRHIVAEDLGDKGGIGQKSREPVGDLRQSIGQRRCFEHRAALSAEFIERVSHGSLRSDPLSSYTNSQLCASAVNEYDRPARKTAEERMSRVAGLIGLAAMASVALWPPPSPAQEPYPSRTVKIVVPAVPGSTTDALARIVADQLSQKWGKATIVENIPGGAMNIGALSVARAAPDGYTLLIAPPSPLSFNHLLYRDTGYEPSKFVPITMLAKIPNVLVVRKDLAAATLKELIDYGKANPGKLTYASQGVGSTAHLSAAQLEVQTGIRMVHVPYRGAQPALTDVVAGHVDMFFDTLATSVPLYRDNKVKLMGVADLKRAGVAPEVPTISEAGLPGFKSITWFGLVAPPAMPAVLGEKINRDVVEILNTKDVGDMLRKMSLETGATAPAETARFFAEETALWSKVIKEAGIEPQ